MKKEYFDIVNEKNQIIGKATREECHRDPNLIHRDFHVFVLNAKEEIFLKKRSRKKDLYRGMWEGSASGHINLGETYEAAAIRELDEELGIKDVQLEKIAEFQNFNQTERQISQLFICKYDGPVKLNKEEATEGRFFSVNEILSDLKSGKRQFTPGTKLAIKEYLKSKIGLG